MQQPLTHHQILALVAPFTRAGRQVDLAASERQARRLAFRPVQHAARDGHHPALSEVLWLELPEGAPCTLRRVLSADGGLEAELAASGADPAALLARIDAVPPQRQWAQGPGWTLAISHRVAAAADGANGGLQPVQATLQLEGWRLRWLPPPVHSRLGELRLVAAPATVAAVPPRLPEDLLAVLGHAWTRMVAMDGAWIGHLRQRGTALAAAARVEQRLQHTAGHLAATLGAAPAQFHPRHRWARWRVAGRRAVPALLSLGLVAAAAAVPRLSLAPESVLRMLILNAPPLLLIGFFCLREVPRIELPPLPRPLRADAWRPVPPASGPAPRQPAPGAAPQALSA